MKQETKVTLRNYAICFGIEALIVFLVIWANDFFTQNAAVNIQILSDAFFTAGILMTLYAGLMYVSSEGALIGIGFVLKHALFFFIPMGRAMQEKYSDYRARKLKTAQNHNNSHILVTGLIFIFIGVVFTVIWYTKFYNV